MNIQQPDSVPVSQQATSAFGGGQLLKLGLRQGLQDFNRKGQQFAS